MAEARAKLAQEGAKGFVVPRGLRRFVEVWRVSKLGQGVHEEEPPLIW